MNKPPCKDSLEATPTLVPVTHPSLKASLISKEFTTSSLQYVSKIVTFAEHFVKLPPLKEDLHKANGLLTQLTRTEEKNYINYYWRDIFCNMRSEESRSMLHDILGAHPHITKFLRAHLIDWIFHVCKATQKEDENIPFASVRIMDKFYKNEKVS